MGVVHDHLEGRITSFDLDASIDSRRDVMVLAFTITFLIAFGQLSLKSDAFLSYNFKLFLRMPKCLDQNT
jgi:hypothetical protein